MLSRRAAPLPTRVPAPPLPARPAPPARSLGCMGAVSFMQLGLGVVVPTILTHILDLRSPGGKPYLPHVQAKRWLLQA